MQNERGRKEPKRKELNIQRKKERKKCTFKNVFSLLYKNIIYIYIERETERQRDKEKWKKKYKTKEERKQKWFAFFV